MFKFQHTLFYFLVLSIFLFSCKHNSILIIKKEVKMQMPGRQGSAKSAHYKVAFIPQVGSDQITFQKIMLNEKELAISMYDNAGQRLTAFNPQDTVNLVFSNISNDIQSNEIANEKFILFYFVKNKCFRRQ